MTPTAFKTCSFPTISLVHILLTPWSGVRQALLRATDKFPKIKSEQRRQLLDYTVGVTFLGCPFRGSWAIGTVALTARLEKAKKDNKEFTYEFGQYLKTGTPEKPSPLVPLVQRFSEMISEDEFKFDIVCAFESRDAYLDALKKRAPTLDIKDCEHHIVCFGYVSFYFPFISNQAV